MQLGSRDGPNRPASGASAAAWAQVGLVTLAIMLAVTLVLSADRTPSPVPALAAPTVFSEERAAPVVHELSESIGVRWIGTDANSRAAAYLTKQLEGLPGVEVDVQDASGTVASPFADDEVIDYRVRNIVARIPGREPGSLILAAHYDSPTESRGAADNAANVAVLVEVARALATSAQPSHSIVLVFNGGEEAGLVGARAFLKHRWAKDAIAFVNLDAVGAGGRSVLFRGGGGLSDFYAEVVPHPHAWSVGADLMDAGLIPSNTDYDALTSMGIAGLDIALYEDGWAYHTSLDRAGRLERGSLQHVGDNVLALARAFVAQRVAEPTRGPRVYYDVLGASMISYGQTSARVILLGVLLFSLFALVLVTRRGISWAFIAKQLGIQTLVGVGATLLVVGPVLALSLALGRSFGWYNAPGLAAVTFGALALAISCGLQVMLGRDTGCAETRRDAQWASALVAGAILLSITTLIEARISYLPLWWTLPAAFACTARRLGNQLVIPARVAATFACALAVSELVRILLTLFVPITGRLPLGVPLDACIALFVALPVSFVAVPWVTSFPNPRSLKYAAWSLGALGIAMLTVLVSRDPFDPQHPRRVSVQHSDLADAAGIVLGAGDGLALPRKVLALADGMDGLIPQAPARVTHDAGTSGHGRRVGLTIEAPGASALSLRLPRAALAGWDLEAPMPSAGEFVYVRIVAPEAEGWSCELELHGTDRISVQLVERYDLAQTPQLTAVLNGLPASYEPSTSIRRVRTHSL